MISVNFCYKELDRSFEPNFVAPRFIRSIFLNIQIQNYFKLNNFTFINFLLSLYINFLLRRKHLHVTQNEYISI